MLAEVDAEALWLALIDAEWLALADWLSECERLVERDSLAISRALPVALKPPILYLFVLSKVLLGPTIVRSTII